MGWAEIKFFLAAYGYEEIQHDLGDTEQPAQPKSDHVIYDGEHNTMLPVEIEVEHDQTEEDS